MESIRKQNKQRAKKSHKKLILGDNYLEIFRYRIRVGKKLNLKSPKRFTEKIQWLKLYYRTPLLTLVADKYRVRDYIKDKIGEKYLIPLVGAFDSFDEIEKDALPNAFILKANHGSGWNVLCDNKDYFDFNSAQKKFNLWMKLNYYYPGRAWEYKNIKPKIVCEEFISSPGNVGLDDYKIHCFNGVPTYIQFITDRYSGAPRESFYDTSWNMEEFILTYPRHETPLEKPGSLKEMIALAQEEGVLVDFLGVLGKEELLANLQKSDIFVLPSLNEGMSNSVLEAMSCGLPVIVTSVGGSEELVDGNGFIVDSGSIEGLRQALEKFIDDEGLLDKCGSRSREIAEKLSWGITADEYAGYYSKLI